MYTEKKTLKKSRKTVRTERVKKRRKNGRARIRFSGELGQLSARRGAGGSAEL